jgi:hypothetical protein
VSVLGSRATIDVGALGVRVSVSAPTPGSTPDTTPTAASSTEPSTPVSADVTRGSPVTVRSTTPTVATIAPVVLTRVPGTTASGATSDEVAGTAWARTDVADATGATSASTLRVVAVTGPERNPVPPGGRSTESVMTAIGVPACACVARLDVIDGPVPTRTESEARGLPARFTSCAGAVGEADGRRVGLVVGLDDAARRVPAAVDEALPDEVLLDAGLSEVDVPAPGLPDEPLLVTAWTTAPVVPDVDPSPDGPVPPVAA